MTVLRSRTSLLTAALLAAGSTLALAATPQDAFRTRFGQGVRLIPSTQTGFVQDIYGNALDLGVRAGSDADFVAIARALVDEYSAMFGITGTELDQGQVLHHALARIGTTDKVSVEFAQVAGDMLVTGASVCVLFDSQGRILSVQNQTVPGATAVPQLPTLAKSAAMLVAEREFGNPIEEVRRLDTTIVGGSDGRAILAYLIELRSSDQAQGAPIQELLTIDAHTGLLVRRESTIHFVDLTGNVDGWGSPGVLPDKSTNPEAILELNKCHGTSAVGNADTDQNGNFTIPYGGGTPQSVTFDFGSDSPFAYVVNQAGAELTLTQSVTPGVPAQFTLNPGKAEFDTSQVNAHIGVLASRQMIKNVDPADLKPDFRARANVNINSSCNAYYDGSSINFYKKAGGCENTAYSTVISHELGHWYNEKYSSGNGSDGFGEGAADIWGMYVWDDPTIGKDFCGSGCFIRTGTNTKKYDGTCGGGCSQGVHECGKVLMGAVWKVRRNLNNTLGDAVGDLVADTLNVKWFQAYNDKTICDLIENHWLVLDDTDGNIFNGTPHFGDIDGAFREQGFPGIDLTGDCTTPVNYGTGTAGTSGVPHIESIGYPQIGTTFTIRGEGTEYGITGFLAIGFAKATLYYGSTLILVDLVGPHLLVPITTTGLNLPGFGEIEVPGPIPNDIGLDGLHFYSQFLFNDSGADSGLSATEGLDSTICCGC